MQAKAYLANPSASVLAQLQTQVVAFQQQVNASLLKRRQIVDTASQKHALSAIQAVATIVNAMLGLVESISSKAAVAQMAGDSGIELRDGPAVFGRIARRRSCGGALWRIGGTGAGAGIAGGTGRDERRVLKNCGQ